MDKFKRIWIDEDNIPAGGSIEYIRADTVSEALQWIAVEDRLPKTYESVLVGSNDSDVAEYGYYTYCGEWLVYDPNQEHGIALRNVTHWQPLPELPNE